LAAELDCGREMLAEIKGVQAIPVADPNGNLCRPNRELIPPNRELSGKASEPLDAVKMRQNINQTYGIAFTAEVGPL
jgi:hypothetical protein